MSSEKVKIFILFPDRKCNYLFDVCVKYEWYDVAKYIAIGAEDWRIYVGRSKSDWNSSFPGRGSDIFNEVKQINEGK